MNGQSSGVYLFGSLDGFWRCTGSGLHVLFVAISCYLAERDLYAIQSKLLAWQLHFWVVNEFLFLKTVNANFTPVVIGTEQFPKTRLRANPFLWKWVLFPMRIKNRFHINALHLASLWNRGPGKLGNGQSLLLTRSCDLSCAAFRKFCSSSTNCWGTVPKRPSSWVCESFWASFSGRPRKRWRSTTWASYQNNKR